MNTIYKIIKFNINQKLHLHPCVYQCDKNYTPKLLHCFLELVKGGIENYFQWKEQNYTKSILSQHVTPSQIETKQRFGITF